MIQYNNFLIKREQSRAGSRFAECEKSRLKAKILMTLALLLTTASGAWAEDLSESFTTDIYQQTTYTGEHFTITGQHADMDGLWIIGDYGDSGVGKTVTISSKNGENITRIEAVISYKNDSWINNVVVSEPGDVTGTYSVGETITINSINATTVTLSSSQADAGMIEIKSWTIYYTFAFNWNAENNTGTFKMPGGNVLLTPIYSAATVYQADGVTEKKAYASLKEAFAAVQSGDVIKLDWNVDVNGQALTTPSTGDGLKFTLDFNGYTIKNKEDEDLINLYLKNSGDEITFIDSSDGQTGGYKGITNFENGSRIIIAGGRYNLNDQNAATLNQNCLAEGHFDLAPGMQFVDLEGGATANNGFNVRATYKDINLTIGSKRFATFYAATNFKLTEGTPAGVGIYTITKINDTDGKHTSATATQLGSVIANNTPMLVYNGSDAQKTVTLQATTLAATATTVKPIAEFKGSFVDRTFTDADMAAADYYALSGGKAFAPVKGSGTLGANKCWLQFDKQQTGNAPVSLMIVFEDEDAGLTEVKEVIGVNEVSDDTIYDLSGRKVGSTLKKGVYIKNGQKVVK